MKLSPEETKFKETLYAILHVCDSWLEDEYEEGTRPRRIKPRNILRDNLFLACRTWAKQELEELLAKEACGGASVRH